MVYHPVTMENIGSSLRKCCKHVNFYLIMVENKCLRMKIIAIHPVVDKNACTKFKCELSKIYRDPSL